MVGQFSIARKLKIPSVLLIRKPADSISSLVVADPSLGVKRATDWWVYYYRKLIPFREHLLTLTFEKLVNDTQASVREISEFSGVAISAPPYDEEMRRRIKERMTARGRIKGGYMEKKMPHLIPMPTPEKEMLKEQIRAAVVDQVMHVGADEIYMLFA
ncbi:hypothetical protein ABQE58_24300 [Mycolicibacterium elephantis]